MRRAAAFADAPTAEYSGRSVFHRPPPQGHPLPRRLPERPGEPQPNAGAGILATTLLMFATSTIGMLALAAVEHSTTMLLELPVLGASTLVSTGARQWYSRRRGHTKEHRAQLEARWREFDEAVGARLEEERRRLAADYPEPRELYRRALTASSRLWERHPADPDFLALRLGIGAMERALVVDQTIAEASYLSEDQSTWQLQDVPVTVSLPRDGALGVVGPPHPTRAAAAWLVAQAAVQSGPADLAIAVLVDPDDVEACRAWSWARWLPHTAADDGDVRVTRLGDMAQPAKIIRQLAARTASGAAGARELLVVVDGAAARAHPKLPDLLRQGARVIAVARNSRRLPEHTRATLHLEQDGQAAAPRGQLVLSSREGNRTLLLAGDQVAGAWSDRLGRALAGLSDPGPWPEDTSLPDEVSLSALLARDGTGAGPESEAAGGRLRAVIGQAAGGGTVSVDFDQDPHLILAGTTGYGKSVLLHGLVGSLAASHPPDRVAFVLIDFKNSSSFACYRDLPNAEVITSGDANRLVSRVLTALVTAVEERNAYLGDGGLIRHHQLHDSGELPPDARWPLPHLFVVVDEYATLAKTVPEAGAQLTQIARLGRSAGVHLVVGSQHPGDIDPGVRSQCVGQMVALALKADDSNRLLGHGRAAELMDQPRGRALLQHGERSAPVLFQAGHLLTDHRPLEPDEVRVRAAWPPPVPALNRGTINLANSPDVQRITRTVLTRDKALRRGMRDAQWRPWLAELPRTLPWAGFTPEPAPPGDGPVVLSYGLADLPEVREQRPAVWRLAASDSGNFAVHGTDRSGRSTVLHALVASARA